MILSSTKNVSRIIKKVTENDLEKSNSREDQEREIEENNKTYNIATFALIDAGDRDVGSIVIFQNITDLSDLQERIVIAGILFALVIFVFSLFASLFISKRISRPIIGLTDTAKKVNKGNLLARAKVYSGDEVGELTETFNKMTLKLKESQTDLEAKVNEKTKTLSNNVKQLKKAKLSLEDSEDKFKKITSSAKDAIIMLDNDGKVSYWNKATEEIFGYTQKEITGGDLHELLAPNKYMDDYKKGFGKFKNTGKGNAVGKMVELEGIRKDGKVIPIELAISAVKIKSKWNAIGILRDVTERKKAEKSLKENNRKLKELDKLKSSFISTVSHELRTPLTPISEGVSIVADGSAGDVNKKQAHFLDIAQRNIERLARLINELLDISRIEAGRLKMDKKSIDLKKTIGKVADTFSINAKKKGIKLIKECDIEDCTVYADEDKIVQVFTNLINNSLKFTDKGSITIKCEDKGKYMQISIIDTGKGIPKDKLKAVFDKFQQLGRKAGPGSGGTGLGLAITQGLVKAHNGRIWAESDGEGKGTKFIFILLKGKN